MSTTTPIIMLTEAMTLISLSIPIWGGRKTLRPEDLGLAAADRPAADLVHWGSKRICNPEALRIFHTLKGQAERACLKVGTRFLGGFLVPNDQVAGLSAELEGLKTRFEHEVDAFLAGYDAEIADWITRHPQWERQLREAVEPAGRVATRFAFRYRPLVIRPAEAHPGTLAEDAAELGGTIFHEVTQIARDLEKSLIGQRQLSQRALGTFRRVRDKLAVLSFVDPRIPPVLEPLEGFLQRAPRSGPVSGELFREGFGLWLLLRDEARLARHGAGLLAGTVAEPPEHADATEALDALEAADEPDVERSTDPLPDDVAAAVPAPVTRPVFPEPLSACDRPALPPTVEPPTDLEVFVEDSFF